MEENIKQLDNLLCQITNINSLDQKLVDECFKLIEKTKNFNTIKNIFYENENVLSFLYYIDREVKKIRKNKYSCDKSYNNQIIKKLLDVKKQITVLNFDEYMNNKIHCINNHLVTKEELDKYRKNILRCCKNYLKKTILLNQSLFLKNRKDIQINSILLNEIFFYLEDEKIIAEIEKYVTNFKNYKEEDIDNEVENELKKIHIIDFILNHLYEFNKYYLMNTKIEELINDRINLSMKRNLYFDNLVFDNIDKSEYDYAKSIFNEYMENLDSYKGDLDSVIKRITDEQNLIVEKIIRLSSFKIKRIIYGHLLKELEIKKYSLECKKEELRIEKQKNEEIANLKSEIHSIDVFDHIFDNIFILSEIKSKADQNLLIEEKKKLIISIMQKRIIRYKKFMYVKNKKEEIIDLFRHNEESVFTIYDILTEEDKYRMLGLFLLRVLVILENSNLTETEESLNFNINQNIDEYIDIKRKRVLKILPSKKDE